MMCADGSHPSEQLHINPDIYAGGHQAAAMSDRWALPLWAGAFDEMRWFWPYGFVDAGYKIGVDAKTGTLVQRCAPLSPRQAEVTGDGPGAAPMFPVAVQWVRRQYPALDQSMYVGAYPSGLSLSSQNLMWWLPEAIGNKVGLCFDVMGIIDAHAPCVLYALWAAASVPVTLENFAPAGYGHAFDHLSLFPRICNEATAADVENGLYLPCAGQRTVAVGWHGSESATTDAACQLLIRGWNVEIPLHSGYDATLIGRMVEARDSVPA